VSQFFALYIAVENRLPRRRNSIRPGGELSYSSARAWRRPFGQLVYRETVYVLDFPIGGALPGIFLADKDNDVVALSFKEAAVDAKQPQIMEKNAGLLSSFATHCVGQGLTILYSAARQVPAFQVGVPDEKNFPALDGQEPDANGKRSEKAPV
jgi:hypothetical protein